MRRSLLLSSILAVAACSSAPSESTGHVSAATTYANLTVTTKTANSVSLAWSYACDDNGMPSCATPLSYFEVIRDGTLIWGSMSTSPWSGSFTDTGLLPEHLYTYTFCAVYQDSQELPACVMAQALTPDGQPPPPPPPQTSTDVYMVAQHDNDRPQVWQYSGSGTDWTAITGTNTKISDAAETGNRLAMLASNGGPDQVWLRSGTTWNPITGSNTSVNRIYAGGGHFYMVGGNPYGTQLWRYSGSGYNWQVLTGSNTYVSGRVAATANNLFMVAKNNYFGAEQVWQYTGTGNDWIPITGASTKIKTIVATADHVYMLGNNGGADQVWQYSGSGYAWTSITGTNTAVSKLAASDSTLAMLASNGGARQAWLWSGSGWNAVTGDNTTVGAVWASPTHLFISATNGTAGYTPYLVWERTGSGWTAITGSASSTAFVVGSGVFDHE